MICLQVGKWASDFCPEFALFILVLWHKFDQSFELRYCGGYSVFLFSIPVVIVFAATISLRLSSDFALSRLVYDLRGLGIVLPMESHMRGSS